MGSDYSVVVAAGTVRGGEDSVATFPHRWSDDGVTVAANFTGAHLLHAAVAGCGRNELYREPQRLRARLAGGRVSAGGGFTDDWASTGVEYHVELDSPDAPEDLDRLLTVVDEVAEIPRALRSGAAVRRSGEASENDVGS
jgi:hypothetical protein